jgi:flagellar motor protein MotB
MLESAKGTFFDLGKPGPNENGRDLLQLLAGELGKLPNKLSIEGHTDSKPFSGRHNSNYGPGSFPPIAPIQPAALCKLKA